MRTYGWGDEEALNDPIGAVHCEEGRVVAFPNVLQHCVQVSSDYVMHPSFAASTPPFLVPMHFYSSCRDPPQVLVCYIGY